MPYDRSLAHLRLLRAEVLRRDPGLADRLAGLGRQHRAVDSAFEQRAASIWACAEEEIARYDGTEQDLALAHGRVRPTRESVDGLYLGNRVLLFAVLFPGAVGALLFRPFGVWLTTPVGLVVLLVGAAGLGASFLRERRLVRLRDERLREGTEEVKRALYDQARRVVERLVRDGVRPALEAALAELGAEPPLVSRPRVDRVTREAREGRTALEIVAGLVADLDCGAVAIVDQDAETRARVLASLCAQSPHDLRPWLRCRVTAPRPLERPRLLAELLRAAATQVLADFTEPGRNAPTDEPEVAAAVRARDGARGDGAAVARTFAAFTHELRSGGRYEKLIIGIDVPTPIGATLGIAETLAEIGPMLDLGPAVLIVALDANGPVDAAWRRVMEATFDHVVAGVDLDQLTIGRERSGEGPLGAS